jgi:uncharacterized protein (DUF302 family)
MKRFYRALLLLICCAAASAQASDLLTVRSTQGFEEAMSTLQAAIVGHGYKVSRVQRVDIGLTAKGYKTDKYRVVFFADPGEFDRLTAAYPQLIPYMPISVAIFAEGETTIVSAARPALLGQLYPQPELKPVFARWEKDLVEIFDEIRDAK